MATFNWNRWQVWTGISGNFQPESVATFDRNTHITGFSEDEQNTIWQILRTTPKGTTATHWTIKKVYRDIWQLDLPDGYRLEYTVVDKERAVYVLFIGNHDDAAAYLRGKK